MSNITLYLFFASILLIFHSYLFYPLLMLFFYRGSSKKQIAFERHEDLPDLAILIAAYNEEKVIGEKILSLLNSDYPKDKIKILIGSDASSDRTDAIINEFALNNPSVHLINFSGRVGKIKIINHLSELCTASILILTDANVMFQRDTLFQLVKFYKNTEVGIVAANIFKESADDRGISLQEKKYLSLENQIKTCESNAFQLIMGAEGGCYSIRKELFSKVPVNFIVDDFYITLKVLNQNKQVLFNPLAICTEDVSNDVAGEYRRKVRISSGNFQNLFYFKQNLWPIWRPLPFVFWSHKVLRWLTPFFILTALFTSGILAFKSSVFVCLFVMQCIGFVFPVLDYTFKFKHALLKFISHFYLMNFALLVGFVKFCKGIKSSVWQPVERNV